MVEEFANVNNDQFEVDSIIITQRQYVPIIQDRTATTPTLPVYSTENLAL